MSEIASDVYYTPAKEGEGKLVEKMSRFLSLAMYVRSAEEAKAVIKEYKNRYHDSRHVCWAYVIGPDRSEWQINDNGEPSGTAGKPILGQINSRGLTDVVVMVARYFGGIKLGTPGLIAAYRESASLALDAAGVRECHQMVRMKITFPYVSADGVMRIVKGGEILVLEKEFNNVCVITAEVRLDRAEEFKGRFENLDGVGVRIVDAV